uniref:SDP_N domain-containing protein n=1 Tax=Syphacia muris TaxID=451379 RepID=A0A0N5ARW3_9BILA
MSLQLSNTELDQLAEQGENLRKRSKNRRTDYKLIDSEIVKTAPEPLPTALKEQIREMLESRVSNDTSANSTIPQQDRSGYITDVSSATWQFSTQSFSPRSVVSINGAPKNDNGLLKVRTDLSPNVRSETSRSNAAVQTTQVEEEKRWPYMPNLKPMGDSAQSTMTREYNESYTRHIDRYSSMPTLDGGRGGTLIKIKDDRPRPHGIMKSRELQSKEQILYGDQPRNTMRHERWEEKEIVQTKPKVTEIIQKVEEHTRREEVERTRLRREKKEKKQRSGYRYGNAQEMVFNYDAQFQDSSLARDWHTGQENLSRKNISMQESRRRVQSESSYADTDIRSGFSPRQGAESSDWMYRTYEQRPYSPSELNAAVRNAYEAVDRAHQDINNYRYGNSYRDYVPSQEGYMRTSSTRREMKNGSSGGQHFTNDYYSDGRHSSVSDSLRRGEARYIPNGEIREVVYSSRRNDGRVHKSFSTRDVFHSGGHEERRNFYRGSQQNVPFVEFPPTLPRSDREAPIPPPHRSRSTSNDAYRPITKSRSYADWDDRRGFDPIARRRDDEMMRIENEFRDSLLMPLPYVGGYTHKKERRHEQIPGGYETFQHEERSDSGHRFDKEGRPTQFR